MTQLYIIMRTLGMDQCPDISDAEIKTLEANEKLSKNKQPTNKAHTTRNVPFFLGVNISYIIIYFLI